jgi:adenosylcobyric acid synthase (glutamine-hydrolysing) (EC 6.3.5.10)
MGMARLAKSPVLLVGDIDRGGVFAQLYGTVMLLEPEERAMVKGMIVNKFRGDKTILEPGLGMIEEKVHIPVAGVVPYMNVDLEDEDSLGTHLGGNGRTGAAVDIAVIRMPRISNFTDFQVFSSMPEVGLRYVERVTDLGKPDLVILPGSKNTIEDLLWMRQNGLEAAVLKLEAQAVPVFGICGGFQMLGESLSARKRWNQRQVLFLSGAWGFFLSALFSGKRRREQGWQAPVPAWEAYLKTFPA